MPAPIEIPSQFNPNRSLYTAPHASSYPKQEVNFDFGDFQPAIMASDNEDEEQSYSHNLESHFCRDFSCCGLILNDLHDLLQHYEECHVRCEEDVIHGNFYEEWPSSDCSMPNSPAAPAKPLATNNLGGNCNIAPRKTLSDIYAEKMAYNDDSSAFETSIVRTSQYPNRNFRKRNLTQLNMSTPMELMNPNFKKLAIQTHNLDMFPELPTPTTDDELLAHAGALFVPANNSAATTGNFMITAEELMVCKQEALNTMEQHISRPATTLAIEKPYKCPVSGCDKAYKNPNGLKYHNQHGHCNNNALMARELERPLSKPYICSASNCGKKYKNMNGLKYHFEHSHGCPLSGQSISNMPTPLTTPSSSPISMHTLLPNLN